MSDLISQNQSQNQNQSNIDYKKLIAEEYKKCYKDPIYFLKKYCYIINQKTGKIKFELYPFQEKLLREMFDHKYLIILKSRQMGISTLCAGLIFHIAFFNDNTNILILATKRDVAKNLLDKIRFINDNLPTWLKQEYKEDSKHVVRLANNSAVKAMPASSDAGRSEATKMFVIDEAAHIENMEEIWGAVQPALSTLGEQGRCIVLSCVVGNTYVFTDKGIKKIEQFSPSEVPGDYKIDSYNILGKDTVRDGFLFKNSGMCDTINLITKHGNIEGTHIHKLWAYSKNENKYGWYKLQDLNIGDYISMQVGSEVWGNNDILDYQISKSNKIKNSLKYKTITKELAYLFGLYISEGSAYKVLNKDGNLIGGQIQITCGDKEITWVFDALNIPYSCHDGLHYSLSSKNLIELFEYVGFNLSNLANKKIIPDRLLEMSRENIIYLLRGIFDGDGCSSKGNISVTSVSLELINQIRVILINFGILSSYFIHKKEKMNAMASVKNKFNYDTHILEIYGKNALRYFNKIGFCLKRKQDNLKLLKLQKLNRSCSHNVIPNSLDLIEKLHKLSHLNSVEIKNITGVDITRYTSKRKKYKTNDISFENVFNLYNLLKYNLPDEEIEYWDSVISENMVWSQIKKIEYGNKITYDFSLPENKNDFWCHSVIYNGFVGHQTPNGVGGFYHKTWIGAKNKENPFHPIRLHYSMHPDYDEAWRREQDKLLGPRLASQECFEGDTLIYTDRGYKKIKDITIGDSVLTHKGRYRRVIRTYSHIIDNGFRVYSSANEIKRIVTKDHPFYINNEWVPIKDIQQEDFINAFPLEIEVNTEVKKLTESILANNLSTVSRVLFSRYVGLEITEEVGFLLGSFISYADMEKNYTIFYNISFDDNKVLFNIIKNICEKIDPTCKIDIISKKYMEIDSKFICNLIDLLLNGKYKHQYKLSDVYYEMGSLKLYDGTLKGMFYDDFYNIGNHNYITFASKDLIFDIKYLSSHFINRNTNRYRYINYFTYAAKFRKFLTSYNQYINLHEDGYLKNKIYYEQITDSDFSCPVYNIEVFEDNSYITEHSIVHNCDANFLTSGNTVMDPVIVDKYKNEVIKVPIEKRGPGQNIWVWKYAEPNCKYLVSADIARGDGSDFSTFHVLNIETLEQVAEFKGQIDTRLFGNMLVSICMEYNQALLIPENSNVGWDTIQEIIDSGYRNLYYSEGMIKVIDENNYSSSSRKGKMVPGFTTTSTNRSLLVNKLEQYFRNMDLILYSDRLLNEMDTFIYKNGRPEAMSGYNDDLIMALAIGVYIRDTAIVLANKDMDYTRNMLSNVYIKRNDNAYSINNPNPSVNISSDDIKAKWGYQVNDSDDIDLREFL